jgi:AraC-like DNA-binding protein
MSENRSMPSIGRLAKRPYDMPFSESVAWAEVSKGWQHLHGGFRELGYSIEWHDFTSKKDIDWSPSFHPGGVEICLNLQGEGVVGREGAALEFGALTAGFYLQNEPKLTGVRKAGQHQFITVELSIAFLARHFVPGEAGLHPRLAKVLKDRPDPEVSEVIRLTSEHQQMITTLRHPPVTAAAHRMWYHAKALEVAAALFYPPMGGDLFCQRQKRQSQDRIQKVIFILRENLSEPPSLVEIGRRVGCSHFYLSRLFTRETGKTIFQYLRQLRMDRAAELLKEGRLNVTQVSLEVGYTSPSHFSMAFHETFGCCPGLYPLTTTTQRFAE